MLATDLRFKLSFDLTARTKTLSFTDLVAGNYNTLYGYTLADIKGMIKISSPVGVIYANTGYDTDDYTSPDTKGATTAVWGKGSISLPVDADGNVVKGTYRVQYKLSVNGGTSTFATGDLSYNYQFENPTAILTPSANIKASRLTVKDETNYTVQGKSPVNDLSVDRVHTVIYPATSGQSNATSSNEEFAVSGNMWEGTYQMSLLTPLQYTMEEWSGGAVAIEVITQVQGETAGYYKGDDCLCIYYACIVSIEEKYVLAKINGNLREMERLLQVRNDLDFYHNMAMTAVTCHEDQSIWCEKIQALAQSENCMCPEDSGSEMSMEIIPVTTPPAGSGGTGTLTYSGSGAPSGALGADNSFYIREDTGYLYKKLSGTWTSIMKLTGANGADGEPINNIIYTFTGSSQSNGTGEMDLASHTLDNTPDPVMSSVGDELHIISTFALAQNDNGKRIKLYIGSTVIAEYFTDSDVNAVNDKLQIEAWVVKRASNVAAVKALITRGGNPGTVRNLSMNIALSENLHADFTVKVTGQNSVSALGEITCQEMRVIHTAYQEDVVSGTTDMIPYVKQQGFVATAGQTDFAITKFDLNSNYIVFVNGALQSFGHSKSGNTVIFSSGLTVGTEVVIVN